jgi:hypothetical protein
VNRYVKDAVTNATINYNVNLIQIETKTSIINDLVELKVKERLLEDFAVTVTGVDIGVIEIDKDSEEYLELKRITKDLTSQVVEGQTLANLDNYAETLRIQREEQQYAMHKKTQTANLGAFKVEQQTQVGIAGAEALGQMGENGAGNIELGGNVGFNPVSMMAGMALGGAVGQNVVGIMNNAMSSNQLGVTPPPVPTTVYYVAVNGNATGPYEIETLTQMVLTGRVVRDSLVWKQGMTEWKKAAEVKELSTIFTKVIPPIPNE